MATSDAQLVIQITANIAGFKAGLAEAKAAVRSFDSQVKSTSAASQVAAANTKTLAASTRAVSAATQAAGSRFAAAAEKLQAEGLSASEVSSALRSLGATQAETAALVTSSTTAIASQGKAISSTARKVDQMTGAMAYGTARAAAFAGNMGPMGYVIGSVARASNALAPILSSLFGVAIAGMAVEAVAKLAEGMEQAKTKEQELRAATIAWAASEDKSAASAQLVTLKLKDQIAKLEGVPSPDSLQIALVQDKIAADELAESLAQVGQKSVDVFSKAAPTFSEALGSRVEAVAASVAFAAGAYGIFVKGVDAASVRLETLPVAQSKVAAATLRLERITEQQITGTLTAAQAYSQQKSILTGLVGELKSLASTSGLTTTQQLALTEAARAYEDQIIRLNEAQKQKGLNAHLDALKALHAHTLSNAEANREFLLSHISAESVHANLTFSAKSLSARLREAQSVIREYDRSVTRTASDEQILADAIKKRVAAMGAAGAAALATIVPATSPTAPTSGVSFGVGTVSDQLAAAESVQEHLRALQEARVISYDEMVRQIEALDAELYSQRLISEQEYNRRIQTLEDQQLVHNVRLKTAGEETGASLSKAIMDGMTKREPNAMSIELYNWFARSWDNAVGKLMTGGLTNIFNVLFAHMGAMSGTKGAGGLFGGIAGIFAPRGAGTPPFLPGLVNQSRVAGMQSAQEFHDSFSNKLAGLPLSKGVGTLFSGITGMVASSSASALAAQKSLDKQSQLSSAKVAAAHTWKVVSSIPVIGPFIAPAAAAGAFAAVLAFEKGGLVPQTSMALVHKNEMVLPADLASHIKNSMRTPGQSSTAFPGGAGAIHLNYSPSVQALDSEGVEEILSKHSEFIAANLERWIRSKNRA